MKTTIISFGKLCTFSTLALMLAGCVAYVEEQPPVVHYHSPPSGKPVPPPARAPVIVPVQRPAPSPVLAQTAVTVSVTAPSVEVGVAIHTEADFYEPLSPHGEWVMVGAYGRCWRPFRVEASWRPYCSGSWRWTEAGWYWVSDEPWAWATYHYGRWDWSAQFGWIWVPQTQWAPAWVSWRGGAGYVGWAPLPPSARIAVGGTLEFHEAAVNPRFVFVEERRFAEPIRPTAVIVNNPTVINQTVNITKVKVTNKTVINEGPRLEAVEQAGGRKIQPVALRELRHREEAPVVEQRKKTRLQREENSRPPQNPMELKQGDSPRSPIQPRPAVIAEDARHPSVGNKTPVAVPNVGGTEIKTTAPTAETPRIQKPESPGRQPTPAAAIENREKPGKEKTVEKDQNNKNVKQKNPKKTNQSGKTATAEATPPAR